jgi:RHS repeat-associated protein
VSWSLGLSSTDPVVAAAHEPYRWLLDWDRDGTVDTNDQLEFGAAWVPDKNADYGLEHGIDDVVGALPLYAGYWWDPHVRLYHVRHRVYDPQAGRWLQRDPIGYEGGPNLYGYVGNEPWGFTDPMGLRAEHFD